MSCRRSPPPCVALVTCTAERVPRAAVIPGPVRAAGGSAHRATGGCQVRRAQGGGRRRGTDRGTVFRPRTWTKRLTAARAPRSPAGRRVPGPGLRGPRVRFKRVPRTSSRARGPPERRGLPDGHPGMPGPPRSRWRATPGNRPRERRSARGPVPAFARWPPRSGPWVSRAPLSLQEGAPHIILRRSPSERRGLPDGHQGRCLPSRRSELWDHEHGSVLRWSRDCLPMKSAPCMEWRVEMPWAISASHSRW